MICGCSSCVVCVSLELLILWCSLSPYQHLTSINSGVKTFVISIITSLIKVDSHWQCVFSIFLHCKMLWTITTAFIHTSYNIIIIVCGPCGTVSLWEAMVVTGCMLVTSGLVWKNCCCSHGQNWHISCCGICATTWQILDFKYSCGVYSKKYGKVGMLLIWRWVDSTLHSNGDRWIIILLQAVLHDLKALTKSSMEREKFAIKMYIVH